MSVLNVLWQQVLVLTGTVHTHMSICQQVCTHISVILYYMMCTCSTTEILLQYDGEIPLLYLCFLYQNVVVSFLVHRYECDQWRGEWCRLLEATYLHLRNFAP